MRNQVKSIVPQFLLTRYREYQKKKIARSYYGNNVLCPVCNLTFTEFAPFSRKRRPNAICHFCNSLERHRLLWLYLNAKTGLFSEQRIIRLLHFAPEMGFYRAFTRAKNIQYYPCDLEPDLYKFQRKIKIHMVDITKIPFDNNFFDVILCSHVLEHVPDDALAMSELHRVMKAGAWAILQVPVDPDREFTYEDFSITTPEAREQAFGQHNHVRWYGRDYAQRLINAGFRVTVDDFVHSFSPEEIRKYGIDRAEMIYYCRK